jgi:hypothetical protein
MKNPKNKLLFIYNADSRLWNGALDVMHKVFSPKTYACKLCGITYGALSVKKEWGEFIKNLPVKTEFLHRDEWLEKFKLTDHLPAVFIQKGEELESFIPAEEMNRMDLTDLKKTILKKLESSQL